MSIRYEPIAANPMDLYNGEKNSSSNSGTPLDSHLPLPQGGYHESHLCSNAQRCHANQIKRVAVPIVLALVSLVTVFAVVCFLDSLLGEGSAGLLKRAVGDGTNSGNSTFVNRKLYLIIVFVGLFLVVIMAICLSAWCCRGAFENPLCCPCYLCACCGGLACLECIGCGLCAEGLEQA